METDLYKLAEAVKTVAMEAGSLLRRERQHGRIFKKHFRFPGIDTVDETELAHVFLGHADAAVVDVKACGALLHDNVRMANDEVVGSNVKVTSVDIKRGPPFQAEYDEKGFHFHRAGHFDVVQVLDEGHAVVTIDGHVLLFDFFQVTDSFIHDDIRDFSLFQAQSNTISGCGRWHDWT